MGLNISPASFPTDPTSPNPRLPSEGPERSGGSTLMSEAHLMTLEDAIRDAVRQSRSVYEGSKENLMKMFKWVELALYPPREG